MSGTEKTQEGNQRNSSCGAGVKIEVYRGFQKILKEGMEKALVQGWLREQK